MMKNNTARKLNNQLQAEIICFPTAQPMPEPKTHRSGPSWKIPCLVTLVAGLVIGGIWMAKSGSTDSPELVAETANVEVPENASVATVTTAHNLSARVSQNADMATGATGGADVQNPTDEADDLIVPVTYTEKETDVRLTNMYGVTLDKAFVNGQWVLSKDQDVLVWMDLPTDIEQLDGRVESTFPYTVKAGETGVIEIKVTSYENDTIYTGTLEFVAADDLTLEAGVQHSAHGNSGDVTFWNDTCYEMKCLTDILESGKKSYVHYSLFTSAENQPIIFCGGYSSTGYMMSYDIRATGSFNSNAYRYVHGGTYYDDLEGKMVPCEPAPGTDDPVPPELSDSEAEMSL